MAGRGNTVIILGGLIFLTVAIVLSYLLLGTVLIGMKWSCDTFYANVVKGTFFPLGLRYGSSLTEMGGKLFVIFTVLGIVWGFLSTAHIQKLLARQDEKALRLVLHR